VEDSVAERRPCVFLCASRCTRNDRENCDWPVLYTTPTIISLTFQHHFHQVMMREMLRETSLRVQQAEKGEALQKLRIREEAFNENFWLSRTCVCDAVICC
jgi:hypothetical protein